MSDVLARIWRMIIFGPRYSLSWSTVLVTKVHKTDTKEKQKYQEERKRRQSVWRKADTNFQNWLGCPSVTHRVF